MKKLLLIGSNRSVHFVNYYNLVKDYFDEVTVITDCENYPLSKDVHFVNFSLKNPIRVLQTRNKIRSLIRSRKPDIIHVQQANSYSVLSVAARGDIKIPIVITAWGGDILDNPNDSYLLKILCRYVLRKGNYFTSDSLHMAAEMNKIIGKDLDITIANFGADIRSVDAEGKQNIIYSNRLHQDLYRIDLIIRAFKKFMEKRQESWKLVIAGSGYTTEFLKKTAKELNITDSVEFVGWLDKETNEKYYQSAKIFVSIPNTDATSISLLEAMAMGCIPVVSNLPANLEWIVDKYNGIVVSDLNEDFLAKALSLDMDEVKRINQKIINLKATKEVNRNAFLALYDRIYKEKKESSVS
jgi:L-malate glycosyltransferase